MNVPHKAKAYIVVENYNPCALWGSDRSGSSCTVSHYITGFLQEFSGPDRGGLCCVEFWKGESVVVQHWTRIQAEHKKPMYLHTCFKTYKNDTKRTLTSYTPTQSSACIERKQQGVQNFQIIFKSLKQDLNIVLFWAKQAWQIQLYTL